MHATPIRYARLFAAVLAATVAPMVVPAPVAAAQSESQNRAENEALRTRANDLELELKAAKGRIAELERKLAESIARLAAAGAVSGGQVPPPVEPAATLDESYFNASPRALLAALAADYAATLAPIGGWSTPKERTLYFRAMEKWLAGANRRFRAPVEWLVRVDGIGAVGDKSAIVQAVAIDPVTGGDLGEPFDVVVTLPLFKRLDASRLLEGGATLALRGTLMPDVKINVNRETVGPFDRPRFIGPFCELGFSIDAQSLTAARAPNPATVPATGSPTGSPTGTPTGTPTTPAATPPSAPPTPPATPPAAPPAKP